MSLDYSGGREGGEGNDLGVLGNCYVQCGALKVT